jgi:hypothetical protein
MTRSTIQTVFASVLALALGGGAATWHAQKQNLAGAAVAASAGPSSPLPRTVDPALVTAVKTEPGAKRWLRLVAASEHATAAEMPALIRLAGEDSAAVRMLAARWAELDPHHMFQSLYAEMLLPEGSPNALPERWALQESLFETWIKKDATAVIKALNEIPNFSGRENLRMTVVNQLMKADVAKGLQAMQAWQVNNYLPDLKELGKWAAKDPRAVTDALVKMGSERMGEYGLQEVGKAWAATAPEEALRYAAGLRGSFRATLAKEVIGGWAERDLPAAIAFATSQENAAYRGVLGQSLVGAWGKTDPAAALDWSQENLRGPARTEAIGELVKAAATKDISKAADLVAGMDAGPSQTRASSALFETWFDKKDQRGAALDWLASLPDPAVRNAAFERVQWNWNWQDPDGVRDFLASANGKFAPDSMVSQVARNQAAKNPETAMAWAAKLSPEQATAARSTVLDSWLNSRPDGAMDYVRKLPAGTERETAVRSVTGNLAYQDVTRAAAWYHSLPETEQRAAKTIFDQTGLSTEQRAKLDAAMKKP